MAVCQVDGSLLACALSPVKYYEFYQDENELQPISKLLPMVKNTTLKRFK